MRTTNNITLTNKRQYDPLKLLVNQIIDDRKIEETINKTVDASKIRTGKLLKFYPYLDKAEVQLNNITKPVLCRMFHRFGGSLIDFFTPEGENAFCETLKEPCILPREQLHVLVADISNEDAKEMLSLPLLGIVYDSHDMIEANNRGVPIFLNEHHMLHNCFLNIANRLLGKQVPYLKYRKKSFIRRIFNT